jgi:Zn-dependent protease
MRGSLRIARVFGIDIGVHWTFPLLIAWIAYRSAGMGLVPTLVAIAFVLLIFLCVVLHELGHALTARAFGVQTRHITLLPIGGVAALERMPTRPLEEFLIAIAGPAVNVVIGAALLGIALAIGDFRTPAGMYTIRGGGVLMQLAILNFGLVAFNMLPAFPMDGGRVLRSLLALKLDYARATAIAAHCGKAMALLFVAGALFGESPLLLLIAVFVYFGGQAEANAAAERSAVTGLTVAAAMQTDVRTLPAGATLGDAAELLIAGAQQDFPVVDAEGRYAGLLRRDRLIQAVTQLGPNAPLAEAVDRALPTLSPGDSLPRAIETLREHGPALAVLEGRRPVGLLTGENLSEFLLISGALHRRP